MWKMVISIHADKSTLYKTNLLTQLQNTCYAEGESMRDHITKMTELREQLAKMNTPVSDESFVSYLHTSLSLAPSFRTLFITLSATAHQTGRKLTPTDVICDLAPHQRSHVSRNRGQYQQVQCCYAGSYIEGPWWKC